MNRTAQRWSLLAAVALLAAACGEDPSAKTGTPDAGPQGHSTLLLTRVGPGIIEANPGDSITLLALLSKSEVGPVSGQSVTFKIAENPGGTTLSADTVSTEASGVASTQLVVGGTTGTVTVRATSGSAVSKAVWKINVVPVIKHIRIVPDSNMLLDNVTATSATVTARPELQLNLRARVTMESGEGERPLGGETVTYSIGQQVAGTTWVGSTAPTAVATTTSVGEASAVLNVGSTTGNVVVYASIAGNLSATWNILVETPINGGGCDTSADCPAGYFCSASKICTSTASSGGGCSTNDRPCPLGYLCNPDTDMCELSVGAGCDHCPDGFHCSDDQTQCVPDDPECDEEVPCPSGFQCVNGICNPEGEDVIDVTGHWYTKHSFDVREALPGWVRFSADGIRIIDQVLLGQLNLPSWANAIIKGIVQQYVPPWVVTIVGILDAAFTVFSQLESEGEMDLIPNGSVKLLSGQEYWTSFVFYFLPLCNGNIQAAPGEQPACARMDVYTDELEMADLAVDVQPFSARLGGDEASGFQLLVDPRIVKMKFAGILLYVLDYAIQISTGYESLEEALPELVDCEGISQMVQDIGVPFDVTSLCEAAVVAGTQALVSQLESAVVSQDTLNFSGNATARPTMGNPLYADELGYEDFATRSNPDGNWKGKFKILLSVDEVPGRWRASREPFPYVYP